MLFAFPVKFKLIRDKTLSIVTITLSGTMEGMENFAVYQCYLFSEIAKKYSGIAMDTADCSKPEKGEAFVSTIRLIFTTTESMDEFISYLQTNPTMRGS